MIGSVLYTAYDLNTGQTCPALDVTLECGDGNEFSFRDPLIEQERGALLEKMDAYCLEQAGLPLTDFRARYLAEEQQPHQAPGLAQLRACHWPRVGPVCRFEGRGGGGAPVEGISAALGRVWGGSYPEQL